MFQELKAAVRELGLAAEKAVYISYAWEMESSRLERLQDYALRLMRDLRDMGFKVFMDVLTFTGNIRETMLQQLGESTAVIFLCTPTFKAKAMIPTTTLRFEIESALATYEANRSLRLIPLIVQGSLETSMPLDLPRFRDFMAQNMAHTESYEKNFVSIVGRSGIGLLASLLNVNLNSAPSELVRVIEKYEYLSGEVDKLQMDLLKLQEKLAAAQLMSWGPEMPDSRLASSTEAPAARLIDLLPPTSFLFEDLKAGIKELGLAEGKSIFLSYAWEDRGEARTDLQKFLLRLADDLRDMGFGVFLDIEVMEGNMKEKMRAGMQAANAVVFLCTPRYKARFGEMVDGDISNARFEVNLAEEEEKKRSLYIAPVVLKGSFDDALPSEDFFRSRLVWSFSDLENYEKHLVGLENPIGLVHALLRVNKNSAPRPLINLITKFFTRRPTVAEIVQKIRAAEHALERAREQLR
jgi:uncharacterized protein (DUF302 family)